MSTLCLGLEHTDTLDLMVVVLIVCFSPLALRGVRGSGLTFRDVELPGLVSLLSASVFCSVLLLIGLIM